MSHPRSQPNTQHLCLAEDAGKARPSHFVVFKCLKVLLFNPNHSRPDDVVRNVQSNWTKVFFLFFFFTRESSLAHSLRTSQAGGATWTLQVKLEEGIFGHKEATVCRIDAEVSQLETS